MTYDLHFGETETLLGQVLDDEPFLPDLLTAVREIKDWETFLDIRLYDLYRAKFAVLVSADSSPDAILKFSEHLSAARGMLTRKKRSELPAKLAVLNDLLKDQLVRLEELRPSEIAERTHVQPMLRCLWACDSAMERSVLREKLGLAEANLTRVLNLAQTAALITRKRVAKNVQVALTPIGAAICENLFSEKKISRNDMVITEGDRTLVYNFERQGKVILIHASRRTTAARGRGSMRARKDELDWCQEITMKLLNREVVNAFEACSRRSVVPEAVPLLPQVGKTGV